VPAAKDDPFAFRLDTDETTQGLYLNAEKETGYVRDRNVFGDNITAEDMMALTVRYRSGAILAYSLVAFSPWEGYRVSIIGDRGRLDMVDCLGPDLGAHSQPMTDGAERRIRVFPMFKKPYDVPIPPGEGSHGGGDKLLLDDLFRPIGTRVDPLNRAASHVDGAASILVGISGNESIRTGQVVRCDDLLKLP